MTTMDSLEIQKIRLRLKQWELEFQEKNGTKPTKDDIRNAPEEIKDSYRSYSKHKVCTPKATTDVWGSHLNKGTVGLDGKKKQVNHLEYYSNKLKKGLCTQKEELPQPRQISCEVVQNNTRNLHQQSKERVLESPNHFFSNSTEKCLKIVNRSTSCVVNKGQPLSAIDVTSSSLQKLPRKRSSISIDWIERCSQEYSPNDAASVEVDSQAPKSAVHSQPGDLTPCLDLLFQNDYHSEDTEGQTVNRTVNDSNLCINLFSATTSSPYSETADGPRTAVQTRSSDSPNKNCNNAENLGSPIEPFVKRKESTDCSPIINTNLNNHPTPAANLCSVNKETSRTIVESCVKVDEAIASSSVLNSSFPNQNRHISGDVISKISTCITSNSSSSQQKRKSRLSPTCDSSSTSALERKKRRLEDKMNSGTANENFVRIDLKRKVYTRGKKQFSGGKYKRQQWKNRQRMRDAASNGPRPKKGACFKCGEMGHWSNNCPKKTEVFEEITPVGADDKEDCPFLSLEEAAALALGIKPGTKPQNCTKTPILCSEPTPPLSENTAEPNGIPDEYDFLNETFEDKDFDDDNSTVHISKSDPICTSTSLVKPYFELDSDGKIIATPDIVYKTLNKFGYNEFRPGQEEAIMRILSGQSTLLVLATGAGKSLCYQLPAYMYAQREKCITLVISPLVSLMEDQVTGLPACLKASCLHTGLSTVQRQKVCDAVAGGKVHVLLISPEAAVAGSCLPREMPPVAFACIDEAHCVSEWSHNFRPSYLRLCKVLRDKFSVNCIIGLTATATKSTAQDIGKHLGLTNKPNSVLHAFHFPENLFLSVSRDAYKDEALVELLKGERFANCSSIIIYCTRREQTERIAVYIRTKLQDCAEMQMPAKEKQKRRQVSWAAEAYHAGLTAGRRRMVQNLFMSGKLRIVVATVAFGMGLDKADVRAVIHYNLPKSFESYVQEVGRAGRDGLDSHCHLFLDAEGTDICELRRHIFGNSCDRSTLRKLLRKIFHKCKCKQIEEQQTNEESEPQNTATCFTQPPNSLSHSQRICPGHEVAVCIDSLVRELDMKQENISTLLCYLELAPEKWIEMKNPVYSTCTIRAYGGHKLLKAAARKCPPLAAAIALDRLKGISHENSTEIVFPVVAVASQMGWDSGIVKRELKALEWNTDLVKVSGRVRKSGILVEFSDLSFHFHALGDLSDDEQDAVLDYIHGRVVQQEKTELLQLRKTFDALRSVSFAHYWSCCDEVDVERSNKLKGVIAMYFEEGNSETAILPASKLEENLLQESYKREETVKADIRQFVCTHTDHSFSGRAVARIFSGIPSPCYPSEVWGRVRRYWRCHLGVDFNLLCKWATAEVIRLK